MDSETHEIMKFIDKEHMEFLGKGVVGMKDSVNAHFQKEDPTFRIGERRERRLMRMMNIHASYPSPRLSTLGSATYVYPYLLRKMNIERPNQVWSTDISYIPMGKGFLYLYAIIDVHSRYIVSWGLYSTLEASNAIEVLERAIRRHGAPEILNSDQGSQYTCKGWEEALERYGIKISMDGRGRCKSKETKVANKGTWNIFYKGDLMDSFNGETKPIFRNPQKVIEKYEKIWQERHNSKYEGK